MAASTSAAAISKDAMSIDEDDLRAPDLPVRMSDRAIRCAAPRKLATLTPPFRSAVLPCAPLPQSERCEYTCDICLQAIVGEHRYKCLTCIDFDICFLCRERGAHGFHELSAIPLVLFGGSLENSGKPWTSEAELEMLDAMGYFHVRRVLPLPLLASFLRQERRPRAFFLPFRG